MTRPNSAAISRPLFQAEAVTASAKKRPFDAAKIAPRGATECAAIADWIWLGQTWPDWYLKLVGGVVPDHMTKQAPLARAALNEKLRRCYALEDAGRVPTARDRQWSVWGTPPIAASPKPALAPALGRTASITGAAVTRAVGSFR